MQYYGQPYINLTTSLIKSNEGELILTFNNYGSSSSSTPFFISGIWIRNSDKMVPISRIVKLHEISDPNISILTHLNIIVFALNNSNLHTVNKIRV